MIESFVSAYRGCPELLVCLLQDREHHAPLERVLKRAGDGQLVPDSTATNERSVLRFHRARRKSRPPGSGTIERRDRAESLHQPRDRQVMSDTSTRSLEFARGQRRLFEQLNSAATRRRPQSQASVNRYRPVSQCRTPVDDRDGTTLRPSPESPQKRRPRTYRTEFQPPERA